MALVRRYEKSYEEFHRKFTLPFEEWKIWERGCRDKFRWFRSANVFPIEHYKRAEPAISNLGPRKAG